MTDTPPKMRRARWVKPLLIGSLAVNLLIAGVAVGWLASPEGPRHRGGGNDARGIVAGHFLRALDEQDRAALARDALRNRETFRENRRDLRQRFDALLTALRASPYDAQAIQRLLQEHRRVAISRQELGEGLLLERLAAMTEAERAAYADRLEASLRRGIKPPRRD